MATKVILKKSAVTGKVPVAADLDYGELAINYTDGKLFYKNISDSVSEITASSTGTVNITGNQTVAGVKTFSAGIIPGNTQGYANYSALIDFGSDVANTWRKIVDVSVANSTYSTIGFKVDVVDPQSNHASQGSENNVRTETYYVACVRTNAIVLDTPDVCYVTGPSNRIRAVKTATGIYEIQIQNETAYKEYRVDVSVYAVNNQHTVTYSAGTTGSTGIAQYVATVSTTQTAFFQNVAARALTSTVATGTAPFTVASTTRVANLNATTAGTADTASQAGYVTGTNIGKTGSTGFFSTIGWASTNWSNLAIGGGGMAIANTPGAPNVDYGYFIKLGNRDAGGGWGGIWTDYNGGDTYVGNTVSSATNAVWYKLLSSTNYNTYSPTLTGTGATGTWSIGITGNAGTVTDGVYATNTQTISGLKTFSTGIISTSAVIGNTSGTRLRIVESGAQIYIQGGDGTASSSAKINFADYSSTSSALTVDLANNRVGVNVTSPTYELEVNGAFAATSKSFLIDHPTEPGKKLRHGSLEGPEHGVYVRGRLRSGILELPEYWTKLIDPDTITVQLTAIGKGQKLYVEDIRDNKVYVVNEGIFAGEPNCFYFVQAERIDIDKMEVEI